MEEYFVAFLGEKIAIFFNIIIIIVDSEITLTLNSYFSIITKNCLILKLCEWYKNGKIFQNFSKNLDFCRL